MRHAPLADLDPRAAAAAPAESFTLGDLFAAVLRGKWLVLALALLGAAAGFALATRLPDRYEAFAELLSDVTLAGILDPDRGEAQVIDPSATPTIVETIGSSVVIARALADLPADLRARLVAESGVRETIAAEPDPAAAAALEEPLLVRHVADNLEVFNSGRSYVIYVGFGSEEPETAAGVANALAGAYLAHRSELKRTAFEEILASLGREIATLKLDLQEAERAAQTMREEGRLLALRSEALTGRQQEEAIAASADLYARQREAEREADATAAVYEQLLRTERELQTRLGTPDLNVQLFAAAVTPLQPSGFDAKPVLVVLGGGGGLLFGASIALLRDRRRQARAAGARGAGG